MIKESVRESSSCMDNMDAAFISLSPNTFKAFSLSAEALPEATMCYWSFQVLLGVLAMQRSHIGIWWFFISEMALTFIGSSDSWSNKRTDNLVHVGKHREFVKL